jgi:carboxyl-terminal processing protease
MAAALMENNRAQVVGERTYGDAAQRKAVTMDDGSAIILSTAKYYGPSTGKAIQDTGVTPGTIVAEADVQVEYDDNGEPLPEANPQAQQDLKKKVEENPVVKKAIEVLGGK